MARGAFFAEPATVHVVALMAADAREGHVFVFLPDVTRGALHFHVCARKGKSRLGMIKRALFLPGLFAMAARTLVAELALVHVVRLVTADTRVRRFAELFAAGVATAALRLGAMRALQNEVREVVVERFPIELDDVKVATLVVGVAGLALERGNLCALAVIAGLLSNVAGNCLVTFQTEPSLAGLREGLVTIAASLLELGMNSSDIAGSHKLLKQALA